MPHILIEGYNQNKNMKRLNIHVDVQFSNEYYRTNKCDAKLKELAADVEAVMNKYFDDNEQTGIEILSNHEYNINTNQY